MTLIKAMARAHDWFERLTTGDFRNVRDIAEAEKLTTSYVSRVLRLAFLAPELVDAALEGRQPVDLTAERLILGEPLPLQWDHQADTLS